MTDAHAPGDATTPAEDAARSAQDAPSRATTPSTAAPTADWAALTGGSPPAGVVFDCDGTLMDTLPCADAAYDAMFGRRSRHCPDSLREALVGVALAPAGDILAEVLDEPAERLADELARELLTAVSDLARPLPGALETVRRVAELVPTAVASNGPRALLERSLAKGGFSSVVPVTVSGDDVARPKPHPDCYLAACEALGLRPDTAVAVEDTTLGVRSAKAAGLTAIAIGTPQSRPDADAFITGLDDPALRAWTATWPPSQRRPTGDG